MTNNVEKPLSMIISAWDTSDLHVDLGSTPQQCHSKVEPCAWIWDRCQAKVEPHGENEINVEGELLSTNSYQCVRGFHLVISHVMR